MYFQLTAHTFLERFWSRPRSFNISQKEKNSSSKRCFPTLDEYFYRSSGPLFICFCLQMICNMKSLLISHQALSMTWGCSNCNCGSPIATLAPNHYNMIRLKETSSTSSIGNQDRVGLSVPTSPFWLLQKGSPCVVAICQSFLQTIVLFLLVVEDNWPFKMQWWKCFLRFGPSGSPTLLPLNMWKWWFLIYMYWIFHTNIFVTA